MKICVKTGSTATALGPTGLSSVGTSRQPSSVWPSSATIRANSASTACAVLGVARQEHQAGAVLAGRRQRRRRDLAQERVRHLDQDAGAVAGVDLAAAGAAMREVLQHLQRLADDGVRLAALDVDDEADAAGVVLVPGVVEALRFRGTALGAGRRVVSHSELFASRQHRSKIQSSYQTHDEKRLVRTTALDRAVMR